MRVAELRALPDVVVQFHDGGYGDFSHVDRYWRRWTGAPKASRSTGWST